MNMKLLVRYGAVPEVARFTSTFPEVPARNERVVINTHRGLELGTVLEVVRPAAKSPSGISGHAAGPDSTENSAEESLEHVVRRATPVDETLHAELSRESQQLFTDWQNRIADWKIDLELIDLEWTLDRQKLVLYVLGGRGAETTKLALQAAAAGLAAIEVQPVDANGPIPLPAGGGGGCGSGGCGCDANHSAP